MSPSSTMLDRPIVSSRYFFPRKTPLPDPYWVEAAHGSRLACYYHTIHPDAKTVVYFHGNGEEELRKYFDFARTLGGFQGQTLILHARFDELVGAHHAEQLYSAAQEPKQLRIFDQGGHNDIFFRNRAAYMQLVEAFLAAV